MSGIWAKNNNLKCFLFTAYNPQVISQKDSLKDKNPLLLCNLIKNNLPVKTLSCHVLRVFFCCVHIQTINQQRGWRANKFHSALQLTLFTHAESAMKDCNIYVEQQRNEHQKNGLTSYKSKNASAITINI